MIEMKRILVALDFTEISAQVLDYARMLADACGASLHVLHVINQPCAASATVDEEQRDTCERLDALLNDADRDSRHATTACRVGATASEIVGYATENAIDLIVMGSHRHGPSFQMATGSIAESVVRLAACPVLAVKRTGNELRQTDFDPVTVGTCDW
jgi:nucleotide-binding universal stress UspA family protein